LIFDAQGATLEEAIQQMEKENFGLVRAVVVDGSDADKVAEREKLLQDMVADPQCRLFLKDPEENPAAKYLLVNNVLYYDGKHIFPQHRQFEKAIKEYVTLFCK
jgi:hypothetical protein